MCCRRCQGWSRIGHLYSVLRTEVHVDCECLLFSAGDGVSTGERVVHDSLMDLEDTIIDVGIYHVIKERGDILGVVFLQAFIFHDSYSLKRR